MVAQIHRADQHRREQRRVRLAGGARQHAHLPQARFPERVQLRQTALRALGAEPGLLLVVAAEHVHLGTEFGDLGVEEARRLGHHEPAKWPPGQRGERRFEQGRLGRLPGARPGRGTGQRRAWRPGQSTHTRLFQAASQPGPAGTPREPGG